MKAIFALALLVVSNYAFAQANPPPAPRQLQPIRQAKAHVLIRKFDYSAVPSGAKVVQTDVCTQDIDTPVFDLRGLHGQGWYYMLGSLKCPSTLAGAPVVVTVNATVTYSEALNPASSPDQKNFHASLNVYQGAVPTTPYSENLSTGANVFSSDLATKSIGFELTPDMHWTCPSPKPGDTTPVVCTPGLSEYFDAIVTITD